MTKEFDESKHPRDSDGKFTDGGGTKAEQDKLKSLGVDMQQEKKSNLSAEEKRLQELTSEKVENVKQKQVKLTQRQHKQVKKLLGTKPIVFDIGKKKLNIAFTENTVGKNLAKRFNSDIAGFNWKQKNLDKMPNILQTLKYDTTKNEIGKNKLSHNGVKEWHYLVGEYTYKNITYIVNANIADKGKEQFLYELSMKKKKEPSK